MKGNSTSYGKKLDELTKKQTAELVKRSVNTEEDDQVSLEGEGLDGPNVRRKRRRAIKTFSEWIEHEPKEKWALLFDEGGARYGLMTTNLADVYNWVPRGVRSLPLVGIVEFFLYRTCEYFRDRYAVFSVLMLVFAHVISQNCCTCRAHMSLLPVLKLVDYRLVCMSQITS